jgi:GNAT superfamily N-acetyltransferase
MAVPLTAEPLSSPLTGSGDHGAVTVREFRDADGPAVCEIWTSGLSQTAEASSCCIMRPIWNCLLGRLAATATAADGDIGVNGTNIGTHWGNGMADRRMLVAELAGEVVGCCGVKLGIHEGGPELPLPALGGTTREHSSVWRVSVSARARRRGVGKTLMDAAEAWAIQVGANCMLLVTGNSIASSFYCEKCGYRKLAACERPLGPWHAKQLT